MKRQERPAWHGQDQDAAIERARKIKGCVVLSSPPEGEPGPMGYWSDGSGFIRSWEQEICSFFE